MALDRGLRADRRPPDGRAREPARLHRLALRAAVRLGRRSSPRCSATPRTGTGRSSHRASSARRVGGTAAIRSSSRPSSRRRPARSGSSTSCHHGRRHLTSSGSSRAFGAASRWGWSSRFASTTARSFPGCETSRERLSAWPGPTQSCCALRSSSKAATCARSPSSPSQEGERVPFVLTWFPSHEPVPESVDAESALAETVSYWEEWAQTLRDARGVA